MNGKSRNRIKDINKTISQSLNTSDISVQAVMRRFFLKTQPALHPKYRAISHCHLSFQNKSLDQKDLLAKELHLVLVSWGFIQELSTSFPTDYSIHLPVVEILLDPIYTPLWDCPAQSLLDRPVQKSLLTVAGRLSKHYHALDPLHTGPNDHLTTFILSVVYGCIPPFEENLEKGMRIVKLIPDSFSAGAITALASFYLAHAGEFDPFKTEWLKKTGVDHDMGILWFYLWELGNKNLETQATQLA
jgi:hypothetical protein